ncbi:MAG: hypothetical protein JO211_07410 [Acidobacteriaceae bacterium]|nr:hypothetical protein [Acidobacteriaceae bacterium]MBV9405155.1 hypothetical protein [Acidobacteriaceae bacterium]
MSNEPKGDDENGTGLGKLARIRNEINPTAPVALHQIVPPETVEEKPSEPEAPTDPNLPEAE